jgi:hypothetical protein
MQKLFLGVLFLLGSIHAFTQNNKADNINGDVLTIQPKQWLLKMNPLNFFDFEPTIVLGAEYRLKNNIAISLDAGYVLTSLIESDFYRADGFMIKPGIRYYLPATKRTYVEAELMHKQVNYQKLDWLGMGCVNDVPSYTELRRFTQRKNVTAFNIKIGRMASVVSTKKGNNFNRSLFVDYYFGLGVRYKRYSLVHAPDNSCYEFPVVFGDANTTESVRSIWPNFTLGFRIVCAPGLFKRRSKA